MKTLINKSYIHGALFDVDMEFVQEPTETGVLNYYKGSYKIATDSGLTNVVEVFPFKIKEKTSSGKTNPRYDLLRSVMNHEELAKTDPSQSLLASKVGYDKAIKVFAECWLDKNEFYSTNKLDENGNPSLSSSLKLKTYGVELHNDYIKMPEDEDTRVRANLQIDALITGVRKEEATGTTPERVVLHCATFKRNFDDGYDLQSVDLPVYVLQGIMYFMQQDVSPQKPMFIKLFGEVRSSVIKGESKAMSEDQMVGGFGTDAPAVENITPDKTVTEISVYECARLPYVFNTKETLTEEEVNLLIEERNKRLNESMEKAVKSLQEKEQQEGAGGFQGGAVQNPAQNIGSTPTMGQNQIPSGFTQTGQNPTVNTPTQSQMTGTPVNNGAASTQAPFDFTSLGM